MNGAQRHRNIPGLIAGVLALVCAWTTTVSADVTTLGNCDQNYEQCLRDWKDQRMAFLKSEEGYLNLAGLFWLQNGSNTFGSDESNDIVFPGNAAAAIGKFELRDGQVQLIVNTGVEVRHGEKPVRQIVMAGESVAAPITVNHGSLAWTVIQRDNRYAVRLRDFANPVVKNFAPVDYFPASQAHRISAKLHRYEEPRMIRVETVIEGLNYNPWSPGVVRFQIDDEVFELEAYDAGGELFFVFGDQTSGRSTYPAGRFLFAAKPDSDGVTELDFNTAHSPPCAYNDFATCPIASARNRIATPIEAGERYDPAKH